MKKCRKIISTLLIVMLIAVQLMPILNVSAEEPLVITTYGENTDGINPSLVTNKANLTVNNITNGDELSAYKIIDVFYNKGTNEMTYDFTSNFKSFLAQSTNDDYKNMTIEDYFNLTSDDEHTISVVTASTLNVLVSKYATYIRKNNIESSYDLITSNYGDGYKASAEVVAGAYLILPKQIVTSEEYDDIGSVFKRNMYGVMSGNVVFSTGISGWDLEDVYIYQKKEEVSLTSFLAGFSLSQFMSGNLSDEDFESISTEISSSVGKKHMFYAEFAVPKQPTNAINKTFQIKVQLSEGITYNQKEVYNVYQVMHNISSGKILNTLGLEAGTITFNGQEIVITIDPNLYNLSCIDLAFDVELNELALVGNKGNEIISQVITAKDPYISDGTTTIERSVFLAMYGLELTSLSKEDSTLLKGAKYEIYSMYTDSVLSNKIGEFTVGDDGKASFAGVPSGTIYLKQVKAPTGYQLIKEPIAVKIATEDATAGTQEGYYQVITYNDAMWYLPSTGGIGTILYTVIGLAVIGISSIVIIKYKKRMA